MGWASRLRNYQSPLLTRAALIIVWSVVLVRYALLLRELSSRAAQYDFSLYYTSVLAIRRGFDPYFSNLARLGRPLGFALPDPFVSNYSPYFLAAFEPLAAFPIRTAYWIWFSASTGALILALIIIFREYDLAGIPAPLTLALILLFPGVIAHFRYAQSQFIVLLALVLMLHWLRRERDGVAGVALAGAIMLKVFPIVIVGYLASRRRWQAIIWTFCALAVGGILVLPMFGLRDWLQFYKNNGSDPYFLSIDNIAPAAFISRAYWHLFSFRTGAFIRHLLIAGFDAVVVITAFYGSIHNEQSCGVDFSLWLLAMLLVSPLIWLHYLPILIIPAVQLASLLSHGYHLGFAPVVMLFAYALIFILYLLADSLPRHGIAELLSEYGVAALLLLYCATQLLLRSLSAQPRLCVDLV